MSKREFVLTRLPVHSSSTYDVYTIKRIDDPNDQCDDVSAPTPCEHDVEYTLVVDVSGSMRNYAGILVNEFPKVLFDVWKLPATKCMHLVMFSDDVRYAKITRDEPTILCRLSSTNMSRAVEQVDTILRTSLSNRHVLVVISDGAVTDMERTLATPLDNHGKYVEVFTLRFLSSFTATPDTRALCRISQVGTVAHAPINWALNKTYSNFRTMEEMAINLLDMQKDRDAELLTLQSRKVGNIFSYIPFIGTPAKREDIFSLFPHIGTPTSRICLSIPSFVAVPAGTDLASAIESADGSRDRLTVIATPNPVITMESIRPLFVDMVHRVGTEMVVAKTTDTKQIQDMYTWLVQAAKAIEDHIYKNELGPDMVSASGSSSNPVGVGTCDATQRVAYLRALAKRTQGSLSQLVTKLNQKDRVDVLNNQNKAADFLRQLSSDVRSHRQMSKRSEKTGNPRELVVEDVKRLANVRMKEMSEPTTMLYCFTPTTCFENARQFVDDDMNLLDEESITVVDILSTLGGIGIPFSARDQGALPNPWTFMIDKVDLSSGIRMSEAEVIEALTQRREIHLPNGEDGVLPNITGVIPLALDNADAYAVYVANDYGVAALHASVAMRRSIACVPWTFAAMLTAATVATMEQLMQAAPTEYGRRVVSSLCEQVRQACARWPAAHGATAVINNHMGTDDKFFFLSPSTDPPVVHGHAAFALLLARPDLLTHEAIDGEDEEQKTKRIEKKQKLLRSVVEYETHQRIRHANRTFMNKWESDTQQASISADPAFTDDGGDVDANGEEKNQNNMRQVNYEWYDQRLVQSLGIVVSALPHPKAFEEVIEPDYDQLPLCVNPDVVTEYVPNMDKFYALCNNYTCDSADKMFGLEEGYLDLWQQYMVITSLFYHNDEDRQKKMDVVTKEDMMRELHEIATKIYKRRFALIVREKNHLEKETLCTQTVMTILNAPSMQEYVDLLNDKIPTRGGKEQAMHKRMILAFCELGEERVENYYEKLFVFITCRYTKDDEEPCWKHGVVLPRQKLHTLKTSLGVKNPFWERLEFLINNPTFWCRVKHEYRTSGKLNRHGYGLTCPLFYAIGNFRSAEAMRNEFLSQGKKEEWLSYLRMWLVDCPEGLRRGARQFETDLMFSV